MSQLLALHTSPRGDDSVSRHLTQAFVERWQAAHPGAPVQHRDLTSTPLPFVGPEWIAAAFTPPEARSDEARAALALSDHLIAELQAATHLVIGTPMYNFSVPASLTAWVDQIVRLGVTFNAQYQGLLTGKKATVILSSGSEFGPGSHFEAANHASPWLRQVLGFIGITDVTVILAGGTTALATGGLTLGDYTGALLPAVASAAAA